MKRLTHTIALILYDDERPGQVQQVRELAAWHFSRVALFILIVNLAALVRLTRDVIVTAAGLWNDGVYALAVILFPLRLAYVPG